MRVIVCGARAWKDAEVVAKALAAFDEKVGHIDCVVHGGCRGPDTWAGTWATIEGRGEEVYPADWERLGRRAGFVRNEEMVEHGQADAVIAFIAGESRGTWHTVRLAAAKGIDTWIVRVGSRSLEHKKFVALGSR